MKYSLALCAVGVMCSLATPARGQSTKDEAEQMRRQIQALEQKIRALEKADDGSRRVTELGGSRGKAREPELIVRFYDVSDLFAMAPSYEAMRSDDLGKQETRLFPQVAEELTSQTPFVVSVIPVVGQTGTSGRTAGGKAAPTQATRSSMDQLTDAITSTIAPTDWDTVGGPASIARLGNALIITAYAQTHDQIEALLEQLRKRSSTLRTVSVRADWLWLTDAQLESLLLDKAKPPAKPDEVRAFGLVDDAAWQKLQEQLRKPGDGQRAGYQAVITCYNGQTVHTLAGEQSLAVTGVEKVGGPGMGGMGIGGGFFNVPGQAQAGGVPAPSAPVYIPQVVAIQEGAALQVTPVAGFSGKVAVLDVHSRVAHLRRAAVPERPAGRALPNPRMAADEAALPIDRPQLAIHRLSTTLRMPVERRMLVGGMTFESEPQPGQPNLYLFVKVTVQELRDDPAKPQAPSPPKPTPR